MSPLLFSPARPAHHKQPLQLRLFRYILAQVIQTQGVIPQPSVGGEHMHWRIVGILMRVMGEES